MIYESQYPIPSKRKKYKEFTILKVKTCLLFTFYKSIVLSYEILSFEK